MLIVPTLDPFYYLHNFESAVAWVNQHSEDLLSVEERVFLACFASLPHMSRALLVRMIMRKGPLFRSSRLDYPEIGDISQAARPLIEHALIDEDPVLTAAELFKLHSMKELRGIVGPALPCAEQRKQDLLATVFLAHPESKTYAQWLRPVDGTIPPASRGYIPTDHIHIDRIRTDRVYRLLVGELCDRIRLIFFGNAHQTWAEFVITDLGLLRYEHVPMAPGSRAFRHRDDVDVYLGLQTVRQTLRDGPACAALPDDAPLCGLLDAALRIDTDNPWLSQRRDKILFYLGQESERRRDWDTARQAYAACAWPGARHRHVRVLERQGESQSALDLALAISAAPENEAESQRIQRMLPRLRRLCRQTVKRSSGRASAPPIPASLMTLPRDDKQSRVEQAVRKHLHQEHSPVYYVENALINSLFGLLCWEAIFAPLPGAFFHPFQRGPADLLAPDFSKRRAVQFSRCLRQLDDGSYRNTIQDRFHDKQGIQSPFVFWDIISAPLLSLALDCLPAQHLKLWFARLLDDVAANRSGLPDLIRFFPHERRYDMIEVKGPGDRLQDNQTRWLHFFLSHRMPVSVCHVQWREQP
ncbi:MAG: VRR-NUC domain-containing protein [Candidimonas sp.]